MSHSFDQLAPILSAKNLTLQYDSNKIFNIFKKNSPAVRDASFEIFPGEIVGIVGESGSGKSTLMKAICKLIVNRFLICHRYGLLFAETEERIW